MLWLLGSPDRYMLRVWVPRGETALRLWKGPIGVWTGRGEGFRAYSACDRSIGFLVSAAPAAAPLFSPAYRTSVR